MWPVVHHALDQNGGVGADPGRPADQAGRRGVGVALVRLGHVFVDGDMAGTLRATHMAGDTLVIVEDLDHSMSKPHLDGAPDQPVRHRIEGLVDLDMIVRMDLRRLPLGVFERCRRQRLQGSPLDLLEQFAATLADMAHRPVVQLLEQFGDRR